MLAVTDDVALLHALRAALRGVGGGMVAGSPSSTSVAEAFTRAAPRVVLVDLCDAEDGALAAVESIRSLPQGAMVPVLLLGSGRESVRSATDALGHGADAFL